MRMQHRLLQHQDAAHIEIFIMMLCELGMCALPLKIMHQRMIIRRKRDAAVVHQLRRLDKFPVLQPVIALIGSEQQEASRDSAPRRSMQDKAASGNSTCESSSLSR